MKKNSLDRQAIQNLYANIDHQFTVQLLSTNCFQFQYIPTSEELTIIFAQQIFQFTIQKLKILLSYNKQTWFNLLIFSNVLLIYYTVVENSIMMKYFINLYISYIPSVITIFLCKNYTLFNSFEKNNFSKKGAWTSSQDKLLNVVVFGVCLFNRILPHDLIIQDWERISRLTIHHNWKACRNRWLQEKQAKTSWTFEEDQALIQLYNQYPNKWCDIAIQLMKKCKTPYARQGKQCRDRWVNKLDPNINKDPWSKEEELMLFSEVKKKGKRWAEISLQIFQLRRTENTIKNRYYNLIKQEQNKIKFGKMSNDKKEYFAMNKIIKELQEKLYQNQHYFFDDTIILSHKCLEW